MGGGAAIREGFLEEVRSGLGWDLWHKRDLIAGPSGYRNSLYGGMTCGDG